MKIYIASPHPVGDSSKHVFTQMECANILIKKGHIPFVPLIYHFQHIYFPQPYETWCKINMEWIKSCDILVRLPGKSDEADMEENYALDLGKTVYYSIEDIPSEVGNEYECY